MLQGAFSEALLKGLFITRRRRSSRIVYEEAARSVGVFVWKSTLGT